MDKLLGRCLVLGILAGGLALTGDASRLLARGRLVLESTGVPGDARPMPVTAPQSPPPAGPVIDRAARPPREGLRSVDVSAIARGGRIVAWLDDRIRPGAFRRVTIDVVDPAAREVLVTDATPGEPTSPPRRVLVAGPGTIARGSVLEVEPRGLAGGVREPLGTVVEIEFAR